MSNAVRLARAALAWAVLAALAVGAPLALLAAAGSPIPGHLPGAREVLDRLMRQDDGTLLLGALRLVAWTAWASFAAAVLLDAAARARGLPAPPRLPGLGAPQRLASGLITVALLGAGSPAMAAPLPAAAATPVHHRPVDASASVHDQDDDYQVRPGDTLSGIAERRLGEAGRWKQVWRLNQGQRQSDGGSVQDPDLIRPGWQLRLPDSTPRKTVSKPRPHRHPAPPVAPTAPPATPSGPPATRPVPQHPQARPKPSHTPASEHVEPTRDGRDQTRAPEVTSVLPTLPDRLPHGQDTAAHDEHDRPGRWVMLRSGSMMAMSFAAGITTALAASRLRRRRRHVPPPVRQGVHITDEPALAPSVRDSSRAHRRAEAVVRTGAPPPTDHERVRTAFTLAPLTHLEIGVDPNGEPVEVDVPGLVLALSGPGSDDVARALALAVLNESDPARARLILPAPEAERLLGPSATTVRLPGLKIADNAEVVGQFLEHHRRIRAALAVRQGLDGVAALRAADPGEAVPTLVAFGGPDADVPRLRRVVDDAARFAVAAVLLSESNVGTACTVDADGTVTSATGPLAERLRQARLFQVTADDAPEFLRVLAVAHAALSDETGDVDRHDDASDTTTDPSDLAGHGTAPDHVADLPEDGDMLVASGGPENSDALGNSGELNESPEQQPPIRLRVLGRPSVRADDDIALSSRNKAFELLVYLALHPGATRGDVCAALWPDHEPGDRFHSALRHLRDPLREATDRDSRFVFADGDRYQIDREVISVDVWDFERALAAVRAARDDSVRLTALEAAADLCGGEPAEGATWEWLDEDRYPLVRAQCDVLAQLAELTESDDPERALHALEKARSLDPDIEDLYRRIMRVQVFLGRADAAMRTLRLLRARLNEIGLEPERETLELVRRIRGAAGEGTTIPRRRLV
ncbi:BTAD domain-containing putative transcriptional regulator [Actinomadura rupiterrae]|uniref:BTAD domain-containing putative transcriptional regulator n=1 Tax=Actinomadura rupiterrae TaxID=559627 RepID=UPI0020A56937|nr:BTAD domain-containing putative transcriptional regulator [Actinomadura rupiterrae]MCP2337508.1 DNA-binding SARP family transcriptional activator/LysM repeat protein [Actinomadura rupiterrae]